MENQSVLIEELNQIKITESFEILLIKYLDQRYQISDLLKNIKDTGKRKIIFDVVFTRPFNSEKIIKETYEHVSDDEKAYIFKIVLEATPVRSYFFLKEINDPKRTLNDNEISKALESVPTEQIINDFGLKLYFYILERKDYYKLLSIKNDLTPNMIKDILKKSLFNNDHLNVIPYLSEEEKKDYVKTFLKLGVANYEIALYFIANKCYEAADYDGLLDVIAYYAPASVIYEVIMKENLSEKQENDLEIALLKTSNIEYIAYYYFYKNREKFINLFGGMLMFLSFVMINADKFKNEMVLQDVTQKIIEENITFSDDVMDKLRKSYNRKQ